MMDVYVERHFLASAMQTVKVILIALFVISFAACSSQEESASGSELEDSTTSSHVSTMPLNEHDLGNIPLSQDIETFILEDSISLSISQHESMFVPTSPSFAQRVMAILRSHGTAKAKVVDIGHYDLVLRFDGYKDIHLNLAMNSFWFVGADHVYPMLVDFRNQWDRYMIRLIDDEFMYDSFEKTILRRTFFTDRDGMMNMATLFYDGDVRLSINHSQIAVDSNVNEQSLSYHDSIVPLTSYSIHTLGEQPLIAIVDDFLTVYGPNTKLDVFAYDGEDIRTVFSTSEMVCELEAVDLEKGEVTIGLPFANTTLTHLLTSEEKERTDAKLLEFIDQNVDIDDEYIKTIKDGIYCSPIEIAFADADDDGVEAIFISTHIRTVGARTPIWINANVVFSLYEISNCAGYGGNANSFQINILQE